MIILFHISARMELGDVTVHNLKQLKKLNSVILPVAYSDKVKKMK